MEPPPFDEACHELFAQSIVNGLNEDFLDAHEFSRIVGGRGTRPAERRRGLRAERRPSRWLLLRFFLRLLPLGFSFFLVLRLSPKRGAQYNDPQAPVSVLHGSFLSLPPSATFERCHR